MNEQDKLLYNHFDSYPEGLGEDMIAFARKIATDVPKYRSLAENLRMVDPDSTPDIETVERAAQAGLHDLTVSNRSTTDWYCVLRNLQGEPEKTLEFGIATSGGNDFVADSLFCEWAYIINFDTGEIEIYKGFNTDPAAAGRYASLKDKGDGVEYFGVRLLGTFPLYDIPEDWQGKLLPPNVDEEAA
ncbi:hypothetical protein HJG45_08680 [Roseicella sp. DB1501]|nr:hypothetical protein [Roseicella sp. DB1501]